MDGSILMESRCYEVTNNNFEVVDMGVHYSNVFSAHHSFSRIAEYLAPLD